MQPERTAKGNIRVSKPGDTARAFIEERSSNEPT